METYIKWDKKRQFGLEYEFINRTETAEMEKAAQIVRDGTGMKVQVRAYEHTQNNFDNWVVKTDSSCGVSGAGIEIVTPIMSGRQHLKLAAEVLPLLEKGGFRHNEKCGQHIHVDIHDFNEKQAATLGAYFMKMERLILNGVPVHRRGNTYCSMLDHTIGQHYNTEEIKDWKNFWGYVSRGRNAINFGNFTGRHTVEFRFGDMTFDAECIKNRVRFLIWLVDLCKILPFPSDLTWYEPDQALRLLGLLDKPEFSVRKKFSPAILSMKKWLVRQYIAFAPTNYEKDKEVCKKHLADFEEEQAAVAADEVIEGETI